MTPLRRNSTAEVRGSWSSGGVRRDGADPAHPAVRHAGREAGEIIGKLRAESADGRVVLALQSLHRGDPCLAQAVVPEDSREAEAVRGDVTLTDLLVPDDVVEAAIGVTTIRGGAILPSS